MLKVFADRSPPPAFAKAGGDRYERAVLKFLDALAAEVEHKTAA